MRTAVVEFRVKLPSAKEFAERYPQYGPFAEAEGRHVFDRVMTAESFVKARVVTIELELPAVAGVAKDCDATVKGQGGRWTPYLKQFLGAAVSDLMLANGFRKTGVKRAIPHAQFTKGEVFKLA